MTNQSAHPSGRHYTSGRFAARVYRLRRAARWAGGSLLFAVLLLIAALATIAILSPDQISKLMAPLFDRSPAASIAVTPKATPSTPVAPSLPPSSSRPSAASAVPPAVAPVASEPAPAGNSESQILRGMLAEVSSRLAALERQAAEARQSNLDNRLQIAEARLAALIEQGAVTPDTLADALTETRQAAQAAAQEAAQLAARDALAGVERSQAQPAAPDQKPMLAEIEKRLAAMEKMAPAVVSIGEIDKRVAGLEKMVPALIAIGDLERRVAGLEKAAASSTFQAEFDRRLAGVEKATAPLAAMSQNALQGETLALGLLNLRLALDRGAPYADALSSLRVVAANDVAFLVEIDRLAPTAASGVPTMASLRQRLQTLPRVDRRQSGAMPQATGAPAPEEPAGFWRDIAQRLTSIVTVHRLDGNVAVAPNVAQPGGDARTNALERAATRLIGDDLAGAIAAFEGDDEAADGTLSAQASWLRDARARQSAEASFSALSRRSLAMFAARTDAALLPNAALPGAGAGKTGQPSSEP